MEKEKSKEQLISDLYALRAGMSVIAGHANRIKACERRQREYDEYRKKIAQAERNRLIAKEQAKARAEKEYQEELERRRFIYLHEAAFVRDNSDENLQKKFKGSPLSFRGIIFRLICSCWIGFMIGGVFAALCRQLFDLETADAFVLLAIFALICAAVCFIIWTIVTNRINNKKIQLRREKRAAMEEQANQSKAKWEELKVKPPVEESLEEKRYKAEWVALLAQENTTTDEQNKLVVQNHIASLKKEILREAQKAKAVKAALNKTYDPWLSESDWKNTDLLIYYLETGRADNLKEALSMVDRQLQTNQIVQAIGVASMAVSATIRTGLAKLGQSLARSFSAISSQLSEIACVTGRNNDALSNMQRTADFNSALLSQANRTSEQILNEVRYTQRYW